MAISQRRARQGSQLTLLTLKRILLALVVGSFIVFVSNIYCFHLLRNTNILQTQFQLPAYEYYEYHQSPDELNKRIIEGNDDDASSKNEKRSIRIRIRILKERAHRMMQYYSKRGLVLSLVDQNINNTSDSDSTNNDKQPAMEHFKITKFQLSPNHIAGFDFQYVPVHDVHARSNGDRYPIWTSEDTDHARNIFGEYDVNFHEHPPGTFTSVDTDTDTDTDTKYIRRQCEKRERFICRIDMNKKNIKHFAHFAQSAFPCFSALQIARDRTGHTHTHTHTHTNQNFETAELINVTVPHPHPRSQSFILQIILPDQNNLLKQILQMWWRKDSGGGVNQKSWAEGFLNACESAGINVSMVTRKEFNIDKADSANGGLKEGDGSNPCDWRVERMQKDGIRLEDSGWPYLQEWRGGGNNDNDTGIDIDIDIDTKSKQMYPIANSKYFSRRKDMDILQRYVLGREYSRGPSLNLPIRVLMLDRKGATRQWIYSQQTKALLESTWNGYDYVTMQKSSNQAQYNHHHDHNHDHSQAQNMLDGIILDARVIPNPSGTLLDQAREIHNADIIIASHGAALTNLAFIRPCTAVIELLPYGYYLGFFQPLVLAGDGISFDAYLFDGMSRVEESLGKTRGARRAEDLRVSPESIERALPGILLDVVTCRENWTPSY